METILMTHLSLLKFYSHIYSLNPFYIMETILIEDQYKNIVDSIYKRLNPFYIMETILIFRGADLRGTDFSGAS